MPYFDAPATSGSAPSTEMMVFMPIDAREASPASPSGIEPL